MRVCVVCVCVVMFGVCGCGMCVCMRVSLCVYTFEGSVVEYTSL